MSNRFKNALYPAFLLLSILTVWKYRQTDLLSQVVIDGKTMGTTYHIIYFSEEEINFKCQIDSLLREFNNCLSTYQEDSEITGFNEGTVAHFDLPYFLPVLNESENIVKESDGAFDPTVMPLVNAWGFGPGKKSIPDSLQVDSIMQFVGFRKMQFNNDSIWKTDSRVQLDFSAIAKGYGVDIITEFIKSKDISDIFVEIGGEIRVTGKNRKSNKPWQVGILDPNSDYSNQSYKAYASLQNLAMATSGNYFNYYEENGKIYSHTIDPVSGYTSQHNLLSASVFAQDCMTADAWATAFMVMGHEKAIKKLNHMKELNAFLIFSTDEGLRTFVTEGIISSIKINPGQQ